MTDVTSPYIFPFRAFRHLDVSEANARFLPPRTATVEELAPLAETFAPALRLPEGADVVERIFGLFLLPEVIFGRREFIADRADDWKAAIRRFVAAGKTLEFTILGFPFKMPVPLKTNRRLADFGEVVSLKRLDEIAAAIAGHYAPGARIHVFTEGPFHELNGISRQWADDYFDSLVDVARRFGIDRHLVLHDLNTVVDRHPGFRESWDEVTEEIRRRRDEGDRKTLEAIRDALPVRFHNIANPGVADDELRRAYLGDGTAEALRTSIQARARAGVLRYRGFLEARDRTGLLESYAPGALAMTVSPRAGRLGVRPLPVPADLLPYHGVPVVDGAGTRLSMEYLWDLTHGGGRYQPVHLAGDAEPLPFLYVEA